MDLSEYNSSHVDVDLPAGLEDVAKLEKPSGDLENYSDELTSIADNFVCDYEHEPLSHHVMELFKFAFGFVMPFLIISK